MNPYDRMIEYTIGLGLTITGGVFIIRAIPDYWTGVLLMAGVWLIVIGNRLLGKSDTQS